MKIGTGKLLIAVIGFLLVLIAIQFVWITRAATQQEKQFEFTVVAALNKAITELNKQNTVCMGVTDCFDENGFTSCKKQDLKREIWTFIDSITIAELASSKINLPYEFQLTTKPHPETQADEGVDKFRHKCFSVKSTMKTTLGEYIWLHVTFPDRSKFIMAQMGWLFTSSILLILLTIAAFLLIYKSYRREQILATDTRNFISNLTHEFKTPLASIRLANNRISKTDECCQKVEAYTKIINQENNKLDEHINYLLDLSRLQKGKLPMHKTDIDAHKLLLTQTDSFVLQIEDRKGRLQVHNEASKTWVNADSFHLSNVFTNILDNAVKYTKDCPEIEITIINKNGSIIIAFSDNGIGIDKSDQKTIFQEFSRVDTGNVHNVKGFGLGLSYVGQIIELHKGSVWLESKKGEGSTFFIQLPVIEKPTEN